MVCRRLPRQHQHGQRAVGERAAAGRRVGRGGGRGGRGGERAARRRRGNGGRGTLADWSGGVRELFLDDTWR